jgi:hypothetical protein
MPKNVYNRVGNKYPTELCIRGREKGTLVLCLQVHYFRPFPEVYHPLVKMRLQNIV